MSRLSSTVSCSALRLPHPNRSTERTLAVVLATILAAWLVAPVLAADPAPAPSLVFPTPQELVAIDRLVYHDDEMPNNPYMLASPNDEVAPGNYDLPDSTGGFFHYFGHDVSGPYARRTDLCPFMRANGIDNLPTAPTMVEIPNVMIAECDALTTAPTSGPVVTADPAAVYSPQPANAGGEPVSNSGTDIGGTGGGSDDPVAMEIAVAIILLFLGIGGLKVLGVVMGIGPLVSHLPAVGPDATADAPLATQAPAVAQESPDRPRDRSQRNDDPCSAEASALEGASAHARGLSSVLAGLRDFAAQLDQQIVLIENAAIPAEAGVEVAFLAGGALAPKGGIGWVPDILLGKIFEGVMKDQLKGWIKSTLKDAAVKLPAGGAAGAKAVREAAAKAALKGMIKDAISDSYLNASISGYHRNHFGLVNSLPGKFAAADTIGKNVADAVGHLLTLYSTGMSVADLVQQSAVLRQKQAAILDDIAGLEVDVESVTERMASLADDLRRCRWVHSPTTEPLRPGGTAGP
jgi:hypothetical protein